VSRRPGQRHPFGLWLGAATLSTLGDSITFFALGWVAAGYGPGAASLVLTAESVPLCLLILVGGALADRWGIRRTMASCDAAMVVVMATLAVGTLGAVPLWSLAVVAVLSGTAAALRRPADGVFPRLCATGDQLTRTMAITSLAMQFARVAGPAAGGMLVAVGGLPLTSALDAGTFALVLGVLLTIRPPYEPASESDVREPVLRHLVRGIIAARRTPGVPAALLAVVGLAVTVLPLVCLCLPVAGHERGWSAHETGMVSAAWLVGGIAVTTYVARRGAPGRIVSSAGPGVAAAGSLLLAVTHGVVAAVCAVGLVGVGTSLLTTRLIPRFVDASPADMLARFQSLLGIAQTGPVLLATPVLGAASSAWGVGVALWLLALILVLTTFAAIAAERTSASFDRATAHLTGGVRS
jgi:MFS family permease